MRYLFFDIECADGNRAICEYGYVLTDEKFNVLRKRNILMDPECPFNLTGREGQEDLVLTYPYSEYYKYYPFDDSYETIKNLMTQKDLLIFGHAVNNDIGFLFKDCNRYRLPLFDYTAYDIQKMLPVFDKQNKKYTSLENAFVDLVPLEIRSELKDHRACDDAMKTMLVFKAMVVDLEFTPKDLIESCPKSVFNALEYWEQAKIRKKERQKHKQNAAKRKVGQTMWGDLYREHECRNLDAVAVLVLGCPELRLAILKVRNRCASAVRMHRRQIYSCLGILHVVNLAVQLLADGRGPCV